MRMLIRLNEGVSYLNIKSKYYSKIIRNVIFRIYIKVRLEGGLISFFNKVFKVCKREGWVELRQTFKRVVGFQSKAHQNKENSLPIIIKPVDQFLYQRVLIIAELSILQCTKYRVKQKQELITGLGVDCIINSWTDFDACMDALSICSIVIFYRVPSFHKPQLLICEAKRLKLKVLWEVDDLIFDRNLLTASKALKHLDKSTFDSLLEGADFYRTAMISCGTGIASTARLAEAMRRSGLSEVHILENALDKETIRLANSLFNKTALRSANDKIIIIYGSGTSTHNVDFEEVSASLLAILSEYDNVIFRLVGKLDLPTTFERFNHKIERIPFCSYEKYLTYLAESDINIAPLERGLFNDAKSNIKYLEASVLGVPSVCSQAAAFTDVIINGVDGFIAADETEWFIALKALVRDPEIRKKLGLLAREKVLWRYNPSYIAENQVLPIIASTPRSKKIRVLSVNVLYNPRSFGGATIVAEQLNKLLNITGDFDVFVFTTIPSGFGKPYSLRRYEVDGNCVFGIVMPDINDDRLDFDNPNIRPIFQQVLDFVKPNVVHIHCIQTMGVVIAEECIQRAIPYVVTLHDTWWLCGRHFMIDKNEKYCNQQKINLAICENCVSTPSIVEDRQAILQSVLVNANCLLAPSKFIYELYVKNGINKNKILINKNGIRKPVSNKRMWQGGPIRFGYVGGNTKIKGIHLIKKVFSSLGRDDFELFIVDNTINFGYSSFPQDVFLNIPNVSIVPSYNQNTIDQFFENIDVLLFPSQCKESFGLTVREATIRSVWVISTDAGGAVEDIQDGHNGFVVPFYDNGDALREAVLNTIKMFGTYDVGNYVNFSTNNIVFFEDQALKVAEILVAASKNKIK